eukprot:TRINITY_DN4999_c0_g1_i1.p1 TRINITY_DN4999_c0_g1~~TRINITY_DN4999_c0_g1_i1.p1  ORF type:complete len:668 (+),score=106.91 TRINITY_DN4999_c0_g1_i1:77-2005(+)
MPCRILQWLVSRTIRPSDTEEQRRLKEICVPAGAVVCLLCFASWLPDATTLRAYMYGPAYGFLATLSMTIYVQVTQKLPLRLVEFLIATLTIAVVASDMATAAVGAVRLWSTVVMLMDVCLATDLRKDLQFCILAFVSAWLVVDGVEASYRLGVYEIPYWTENPPGSQARRYDCSDPPCAIGPADGSVSPLVGIVTLLVDYMATRGFAQGMRQRADSLKESVEVAELVADNLVRFDLDKAHGSLSEHRGALPGALYESFLRLLSNLHSYRPYLPQSCFAPDEDGIELIDIGEPSVETSILMDTISPPEEVAAGRPPSHGSGQTLSTMRSVLSQSSGMHKVDSVDRTPSVNRGLSRGVINVPQVRRLTLLHCNRSGFLSAAGQEQQQQLAAWLAAEITQFAAVVADQKGIVDLVAADHLYASFGAVRNLGTHRSAAVRCADRLRTRGEAHAQSGASRRLAALPTTAAACSGRALCGDFGGAAAQRFMVVGGVGALLPAAERAAAVWGCGLLCDQLVREDTDTDWDWRLRATVMFPKRGSEGPLSLWELLCAKPILGGVNEEWMYQLHSVPPNPWEQYNAAVTAWCLERWETALALCGTDGEEDRSADPGTTAAALAKVRASVACRAPPPSGELAVTSFRPSPV